MTYAQAKRAYQRMLDDGATLRCACGCGVLVDPRDWHLGHNDARTRIIGPMTSICNLSAAGRASRSR